MEKLVSFAMVVAVLALVICGTIQCVREIAWCNNRELVEYRGKSGDTLIAIGNRSKPNWMGIDEWCEEVCAINGMQNTDIYAGEIIKIYVWNAD